MILGKMFPIFVYRDEVPAHTPRPLLGMCPRGEVGAGVIVISLTFGIGGDAITIAVICLALNLMASSLFIMSVKLLASLEHGTATMRPVPPRTRRAHTPLSLQPRRARRNNLMVNPMAIQVFECKRQVCAYGERQASGHA